MKPLILVVEDNRDILYNIKLILETNNYQVETAKNGKEGIKILSELRNIPAVIISDIMMPEMNGYDFFTAVTNSSRWNRIPFIFLTARATVEDVRFGKLLGVDDYLTKPFDTDDLLSIIKGKIVRSQKTNMFNKKVEELITSLNIDVMPSISTEKMKNFMILLMMWDDHYGPRLESSFPKKVSFSFQIKDLGSQLFQSSVSIYGRKNMDNPEGLLLNIENVKMQGYIYFDSYPDNKQRAGEKQYMLAIIAPKINYFESLKVKEIFKEFSIKIKEKKKWSIENYWKKISKILTTSTSEINSKI